jgi:tetratricopeptide (TPR) repeat protein
MRLSDAIRTLADIASALDYLHSRNVCHSDVKAENVLFSVNGQAKLNDLDRSAYVPHGEYAWPWYGTNHGWPLSEIGPELRFQSIPDLRGYYELDWLQFCIMAYEVLTGRVLPREFVPPHQINRHVPFSLSQLIYRNINPQEAGHRNLYDVASKVRAAEQEVENDVLLMSDWEHYLRQNLRLDVFPIGLPYSSVGPGGNVYSTELGFIHHGYERKVTNHFIDVNLHGCAAFSNGQFQRALEYFQEAARERDHFSIVHYNTAVTLMKLGKQREAVNYLRGIQREGNKSVEVRCGLMVALSAVDPMAAYELAQGLVAADTTRAYGRIGERWLDESQLERGMGMYSCELAAVVCFRAGDYELARRLLSRTVHLGSMT